MSLIRDSLKKVQEKEGQGGSSAEAPSAEDQRKPPRKYYPSIIILVLIGLALVGLTYFMLFRPGQIPVKKPPSPVMVSPLIAQAPSPSPPAPANQAAGPAISAPASPLPELKEPRATRSPSSDRPGAAPLKSMASLEQSQDGSAVKKQRQETLPGIKLDPSGTGLKSSKVPLMEKEILTAKEDASNKPVKQALSKEIKKARPKEKGPAAVPQEAITSYDSNLYAAYSKAYALQQAGRLDQAMELYRDILHEDPHNPYVLNNLALLYQQRGEIKQAIPLYERAYEADPKFTQPINNLAVILYRLGEYDQSQRWLERSLQVRPDNSGVLLNLSLIYKKKGRKEEARQLLKKALALDPQLPELYYNLARLEEESGNPAEALKNYQLFIRSRNDAQDQLSQEVSRYIEKWPGSPVSTK